MTEPSRLRIGDAERDDAVQLLTDHLAAGRLDHDEFDERLGLALTAHTHGELDALFDDLPGRRPGQRPGATVAPVGFDPYTAPLPAAAVPEPVDEEPEPKPWWTSSWIFFAVLGLSVVTRGVLSPLVGLAAVWCWWLGPSLVAGYRQRDREIQRRKERERRQLGR